MLCCCLLTVEVVRTLPIGSLNLRTSPDSVAHTLTCFPYTKHCKRGIRGTRDGVKLTYAEVLAARRSTSSATCTPSTIIDLVEQFFVESLLSPERVTAHPSCLCRVDASRYCKALDSSPRRLSLSLTKRLNDPIHANPIRVAHRRCSIMNCLIHHPTTYSS